MTVILFLARFYPFWALPMALICGELAFYYRTKKLKKKYMFFGFWTLTYIATSGAWIFLDGYTHLVPWVQSVFSS